MADGKLKTRTNVECQDMKFLEPEQEQMIDDISGDWGKRPNSGGQGASSEENIRVPD